MEYKKRKELFGVTKIRQDAIKLLEQIPEDKLIFIIQIMQGMNGLYKEDDMKEREKALRSLERLRRKMPEIDYDREQLRQSVLRFSFFLYV